MSAPIPGRLIAVVGPSGVGKDSVISGLVAARPEMAWVRRVITRPSDAGGEPFEGVTKAEFDRRRAAQVFCLAWEAHGLFYGIPASALDDVKVGADRVVNLSRAVLMEAASVFPKLVVLNITAAPETLAKRLASRGRESASDIAARLARKAASFDPSLNVHVIANDGALTDTVRAALDVLQPESAKQ
ncbi:MAG: phosphonate metabolism protein/1,5-bisphosphokinase (PRPP-forming) PhnN [Pseudomonadota bacterium]